MQGFWYGILIIRHENYGITLSGARRSFCEILTANPKKCWGKKVILTPINIKKNCAFLHRLCSVTPVKRGNQCVKAPKIANTAPIEST